MWHFVNKCAAVLSMNQSEAVAAHRVELRKFVGRHGLPGPRVSGSVCMARTREESDLDLLVDPVETAATFALAAFKREAGTLPGVLVSVLTGCQYSQTNGAHNYSER